MKKIALFVMLLVAAAGVWFFFQGQGGGKDAQDKVQQQGKPPVAVTVAATARRDVPLSLDVVGTVVTNQSVAIRSRIDSQVLEVKFKDGDEVKEGDPLFVLDARAIQARLRALEANLVRDRAQLSDFGRQLERKKGLAKEGYETTASLDETRTQYEVQQAAVAAASASIDDLKTEVEHATILAPISGRTGTINVTAGNNVKANDATPLVTINQLKPIRVQVSVPQKYLDPLRRAMAAGTLEVEAKIEGGRSVPGGRLDYVDNAIDGTTGTFIARASFPNEDEALWPGMFVTASIRIGQQNAALTVPEVAIQHGQEGDFIFLVEGGKAKKQPVKVDGIQGGFALVSEGVPEGAQVVVDGALKLEEGSAVIVADSPSPAIAGEGRGEGREP